MQKVLITGSNGLLGQYAVPLFKQENNFDVYGLGKGENRNPHLTNTNYYKADITNGEAVFNAILSLAPNIIVHTAAMTNVDACELDPINCYKNNVLSLRFLVEAAKKCNAFFIHLSTDFIFDGNDGPYDETAIANPLSYYGSSKLMAEKIVQETNLDWAIARTVLVYGVVPHMSRSNIILWVKNSLEQGKAIQLVNDQWRTPTYAGDLAKGCLLIAQKKATGIYNISGNDMLTPYDMAILTAQHYQLNQNLITQVDSTIFTQPAKRPPKTGFVLKKAMELLDYQPLSFVQGIVAMENDSKNNLLG
jgi:dTDP-4-dehydrorhamnose reductase